MLDKLFSQKREKGTEAPEPTPTGGGWCYLGDGVGVALTRAGRKVLLPGSDRLMTPTLAIGGAWQPALGQVLSGLVKPGMRVAEARSGLGYHTLALAELVGPDGHVHAFEPWPLLATLLEQNLALNGVQARVTRLAALALHAEGAIGLAADPRRIDRLALAPAAPEGDLPERFTAPSVRLDAVLPEGAALDLLRLDLGGAEGLALVGAQEVLARSPRLTIVTTWAPALLARYGSLEELVAWLDGLGFKARRIGEEARLEPVPASGLAALPPGELVLTRSA